MREDVVNLRATRSTIVCTFPKFMNLDVKNYAILHSLNSIFEKKSDLKKWVVNQI